MCSLNENSSKAIASPCLRKSHKGPWNEPRGTTKAEKTVRHSLENWGFHMIHTFEVWDTVRCSGRVFKGGYRFAAFPGCHELPPSLRTLRRLSCMPHTKLSYLTLLPRSRCDTISSQQSSSSGPSKGDRKGSQQPPAPRPLPVLAWEGRCCREASGQHQNCN